MKGLQNLIKKELNRLYEIEELTTTRLKNAPKGTLRISLSNNCVQYRIKTDKVRYISIDQQEIAIKIAQKSYDEKVLRHVKKRIRQLEVLDRNYRDNEIEEIYEKCSNHRKMLISPVEETSKQRLDRWMKEEYQGKDFTEDAPTIFTEKGERVRSKSEKILADCFYHKGIPYKYEKPIFLKGYGIVYPDFTFLSPMTGKEIYWEHEGRMDDPIYARSAVKKIIEYENNGIVIGRNLILTFETEATILSTKEIEKKIQRYLA